MKRTKKRLSHFQIIVFGFLLLILLGAGLLALPIASKTPGSVFFFDALFTSVSATCVTGLVVRDTATTWTVFGKIVVITLIQIGGLGVVTVSLIFSMILNRKIGLFQRSMMQESISASQVGGIVKLTRFILKIVFLSEFLGACLLAPAFIRDFGIGKGIAYSLFHSVSAFCNAGFDLMGEQAPFSSLTAYQTNILVNLTMIALILVSGIGFSTWNDLRVHRLKIRRYSLQSKIVLSISLVLIILPFFYFFFAENAGMRTGERFLAALFQTISPRTAGFNTTDLNDLSDAGIAVNILLMLIGGSSGSTAGGMKMTTIGVILIAAFSVFRQRKEISAFGRRIDPDAVLKAFAVFVMYLSLFLLGAILISRIEALPMRPCLFESASAIATVGLTLGITPELHAASKIILMLMMFIGRVGGLTVIFAALRENKPNEGRSPVENVSIG